MNLNLSKNTSSASEEVKEPEEGQNLQEAGKLRYRYIMMRSRLYQIFEDGTFC